MKLSELYTTPEKEWIAIIQKFLDEDVVDAMLLAEMENYIEITEETIDAIAMVVNSLSIE